MSFSTAALCDRYSENEPLQIAEPIFKAFGGSRKFCGRITTLKVFEDNTLVRQVLSEKVNDRVLVIDGGGSHHCALLGANTMQMAVANGWQGLIVYGCVRNAAVIDNLPIGIRALNTHPLKSLKKGHGERDVPVNFAGMHFKTDYFLYADEDGIIVSATEL